MESISVVRGDITEQAVDVIVNAASSRMRGGGGVDGAIHRAGGPAILDDCIARFPDGLAVGDAGFTTGGELPARWVVHTVGPNFGAGERDPELLASCYRRSLEVADELGARAVAFPLVSAGVYRWPLRDAVRIAVATLLGSTTRVADIRIVAFGEAAYGAVRAELGTQMLINLIRSVRVLHQRGYQQVRIYPDMNTSGTSWRLAITDAATLARHRSRGSGANESAVLRYTTAQGDVVAGTEVSAATPPATFADLILAQLPHLERADDRAYTTWYSGLVDLVEDHRALPVAYSDAHSPKPGWEIGWGSGVRYPEPPETP